MESRSLAGRVMTLAPAAEQSLKDGDPAAALAQLQEQVRAKPADAKLRVFLFQLLCVLGQWDRALNQLSVASSLDPEAVALADPPASHVPTARHVADDYAKATKKDDQGDTAGQRMQKGGGTVAALLHA